MQDKPQEFISLAEAAGGVSKELQKLYCSGHRYRK